MNSLDPKITTAIYVGGAVVFVVFLLVIFFYTRSVKTKKLNQTSGSVEQGILQATEKKEKVR
jgi:hypothetical protein